MDEPSDTSKNPALMRDRIIGLGERSTRKSYYPQLRQQIDELEQSKKDLEDRTAALLNILEDLEESRRVVKENEEKFRTVADYTHDWEYWQGTDNRIVYMSPSCERITGYTRDDFITNPVLLETIVHPDDREYYEEQMRSSCTTQQRLNFDFRIIHRDGTIRWIGHTSQQVIGSGGKDLGRRVSNRDVTVRKVAEVAVIKSVREWQTTFDAITDPVFLMDDQMRIIRHNRAMETFLGKTADEIDGRPCHEIMHRTVYPVEGCPNLKTRQSRQRESLELKIGDRWFVASVDPVFSDTGTITGCVHLLVDITDRKRSDEALNLARRKLNLLNAITFSDIRNAVFSLSGYLQLDKRGMTEHEKPHQYTDKEIALVTQVSDSIKYAEIYQSLGLKSPVWQPVSQSFLIGISHLDISRLSRRLDIGSVEIFADPLLENVFFALADNVVQHATGATGYALSCQETPGGLIIFFEDNGPGVPGHLKEKIFEREYGRRKGIGLYLSREILSITGITLRESGEPGKGARFEILVPRGGYRFCGDPPKS